MNGKNFIIVEDDISDGHHTFAELYKHRYALFIALCAEASLSRRTGVIWRSRLHADGTMDDGQFILGIYTEPGKQITYHLPLGLWPATDFASTLATAPEWDGHTSTDVLRRLMDIVDMINGSELVHL